MSAMIHHGEQEPNASSLLVDHEGFSWEYEVGKGWVYSIEGDPVVPYFWSEIPSTYFPMAEVLP